MIYLLDTNVASAIMRDDPRIQAWLSVLSADEQIVLCPIVRGEILYGIERLPEGKRRTGLREKAESLFANLPCEVIPPQADEVYARIKAWQHRRGFSMSDNDLWIAATAIAIEATLVSLDGDFGRIDGLSLLRP